MLLATGTPDEGLTTTMMIGETGSHSVSGMGLRQAYLSPVGAWHVVLKAMSKTFRREPEDVVYSPFVDLKVRLKRARKPESSVGIWTVV